jgi:hypothetical protein
VYLDDSSSSRRPTRPTITIERTNVAAMRMVNPTAMATILRLIDCLIIDPENQGIESESVGNGSSSTEV